MANPRVLAENGSALPQYANLDAKFPMTALDVVLMGRLGKTRPIGFYTRADRAAARKKGVDPGGAIMIHGQPNLPTFSQAYYAREDWTNGCIAVSNSDMIDIWLMTPDRVPIEIVP